MIDPQQSGKVGSEEGLRISLLGGFQLHQAEDSLGPECFRLRKARDLVKLLALAPRHRLQRDQLLEWLWPDRHPEASANSLHQTLRSARQVLEALQPPGYIRFEDEFLCLQSDPSLWVDVEAFEAAAAQAQQRQDPFLYQAALNLYAGELLPEDRYEDWAIKRREALQQTYLDLLLDLARLHEARGEHQPAIAAYQRIISIDPLLEEVHADLMRIFALSGQRAQALRQYQHLQEILNKELEAEPDLPTRRLQQQILTGSYPPPESLTLADPLPIPQQKAAWNNLPAQLTSFIGREHEIAEVVALLADHRLVTLTGSGGVGKTRLALKVGEEMLEAFPKGVWLVELAALSDPELVPQACAQALGLFEEPGVPQLTQLVQYLEKKQLLLVLDNCEHVIAACTCLADALLKGCPRLHILATSRETLSLPGEAPFRVPSLAIPDPHSLPPLEELSRFEAVRLFVDRAALVSPSLALNERNAETVAKVCQRLDGIPLAIELAAARARMMSVEQIAARLDDAFHLLTGGSPTVLPRQQTLRASIDWSYHLLSRQEQLLLQRVSVFAGDWTLEAAEAVCADPPISLGSAEPSHLSPANILDQLTQLVDKSLAIADTTAAQPRYRLLETIYQYALEKLRETGCEAAARDLHLDFFTGLAEQAEPHLRARGQVEWLDRLETDLDNLRAALYWSLEFREQTRKIEQGLKFVSDLFFFLWPRGTSIKPAELLKRLLAAEADERGNAPLEGSRALQRARVLRMLSFFNADHTEKIRSLSESVALLRSLGPLARRELAISLFFLWSISGYRPPEIEQEFLETFRQEHDTFYLSEYLYCVGNGLMLKGEMAEAKKYMEESLVMSRQIENIDGIALHAIGLNMLSLFQGDYPRARALVQEALDLNRKLKHWWFESYGRTCLMEIARAEGNYAEASRYAEEALSLFRDMNEEGGIRQVLWMEAENVYSMGDHDRAKAITLELMRISESVPFYREIGPYLLGRIALTQGEIDNAEMLLKQAFAMIDESFWPYQMAMHLAGFVVLGSKQGKMHEAVRCAGVIDVLIQRVFLAVSPHERDEFITALAATRAALGEEDFAVAWEAGKGMTLEQIIQEILADPG